MLRGRATTKSSGRTSSRATQRTVTAMVAPAMLVLVLAGCGGGDPAPAARSASPSASGPTGSASSSPTTTPTRSGTSASGVPRPPEPPKVRNDPGSRLAFAKYVVGAWSYALATNDVRPLARLSAPGRLCLGCGELRAELANRKKQHWSVAFPGTRIVRAKVQPGGAPATYYARLVVDIPASASYFDDGTFRNANAAHRGATFEVRMRLERKRWSLLEFRLS